MKKAKITVATLIAVLLTSGLLAGCADSGSIDGGVIKGSGNLDTEEFNFSGFTRVEVSIAFEVEIIQSDSYSISITADDNLLKYIQVSKSGETLKIGVKTGSYNFTTLEAKITMPDLYGLDLSVATRGTVQGFSLSHDFSVELSGASSLDIVDISAGNIDFDISGASRVTGDIMADDAEFDISGASTVQLQGSANDMTVNASGASSANLADFQVENADVTLSGASSGTVNLDGRLDADLSGASNLSYIGEPTMGNINIADASTLSKK